MFRYSFAFLLMVFSTSFSTTAHWALLTSGNWNLAANWTPNTAFPNAIDDVAIFDSNIGGDATITLGANITIGSLTLNSPNTFAFILDTQTLTMQGTQPNTPIIQVAGSLGNVHKIKSALQLNNDLIINCVTSTRDFEINSQISGAHQITKVGTGTVTFSGSANTYSGTTIIGGGKLILNKTTLPAIPADLQILSGTVQLNADNQLASITNLLLSNGTFNMNGHVESIASLTYTGGTVTTIGGEMLTLNNAAGAALTLSSLTLGVPITINSPAGFGDVVFHQTSGTAILTNSLNLGIASRNFQIPKGNQTIDMQLTGFLSGFGGFVKNGNGTLSIEGNGNVGPITIAQGTLRVNSNLTATSMTVNSGTLLKGSGTITAPVTLYGTISPGNSIGTISLVGNQVFATGSTTQIEINPNQASLINITGNLTLQPQANLNLIMDSGSYPSNWRKTIIATTTGVLGQFAPLNSRFSLDYSDPNLIQLAYNPIIYSNLVKGGNPGAVAIAIDQINPPLGSPLDQILFSVYSTNPSNIRAFLNLLHPAPYKAIALTFEKNSICFTNTLFAQLSMQFMSQKNRNLFDTRGKELVWLSGFGDFAHQKNQGENIGFKASTGSPMAGWDWLWTDHFMSGLFGGTTFSDIDWEKKQGKGYLFSGFGGIYNLWYNNYLFLENAVYGAYTYAHQERQIHFNPVFAKAHSKIEGYEVGGELRNGYFINFLDAQLMPYGVVDYIFLKQDGFTEKGAGALNLEVKKSYYTYLRVEGGFTFSGTYNVENHKVTPSVKFGVFKDYRFKGTGYTARFQNTLPFFHAEGIQRKSLQYAFGGGVHLTNEQRYGITLEYNGEGSSNYWNHSIILSLSSDY